MVSVANNISDNSHLSTAHAPATSGEKHSETQPVVTAQAPAHPYKKWFVLAGVAVAVAVRVYFPGPGSTTALYRVMTGYS